LLGVVGIIHFYLFLSFLRFSSPMAAQYGSAWRLQALIVKFGDQVLQEEVF
jgi:hypothetical protein